MAEIEPVGNVANVFKGKKGKYVALGVVGVTMIALYMRSRANAAGETSAAQPQPDPVSPYPQSMGGGGTSFSPEFAAVAASLKGLNESNTSVQQQIKDSITSQTETNSSLQQQIKAALDSQTSLIQKINSINMGAVAQQVQVAPVVVQQPTPVVSSGGGGTDLSHISSSQTQYNKIGGGSTDTKPANTTLANGNTIKYDNGPHGWTEYNSSGQMVRAGTASPY